jgi:uncharacterized protein (DUF4415 family)
MSKTDWDRLDAMSDQDIDFSDCPEVIPEMFAKATARHACHQQTTVTIQVDSDVLAWLRIFINLNPKSKSDKPSES